MSDNYMYITEVVLFDIKHLTRVLNELYISRKQLKIK